jgi:hypothetical protein
MRFRNHLLDLSSLRRQMGCFSSKPVQVDLPSTTATTGIEVTQRQSSPVTRPVARRSSQHSRTNAGHASPPVEKVSIRERPRAKSTPQKPSPMGFGEDLPPRVPFRRARAKSTFGSSSRKPSTPVSAGEHKPSLFRLPTSLTIKRAPKSRSQTTDRE